ncbi:uncharacterized protein LOC144709374 [Wolffia australiana]
MEEYLRNMRSFQTQINDFEEEAASISAEEEQQRTASAAMEKDLESVLLGTKELIQETEELCDKNAKIRRQIMEKQKKISSLEIESTTLSQTLELLHKEIGMLHDKLNDERCKYGKVAEELNSKLKEQEDWVKLQKLQKTCSVYSVEEIGGTALDQLKDDLSGEPGNMEAFNRNEVEKLSAGLEELKEKISEVSLDNIKMKQLISEFQLKIEGFPMEVKAADLNMLEEERQTLLTEKSGELEYLQSLQERIRLLKEISEDIKCQCGKDYTVNLNNYISHTNPGAC